MFGVIRNQQDEKLDYGYHEGEAGSKDLVLIGHGVTGNKDRPFVVALAEGLAASGVAALRFSFAGNGASEGRFEDCTISKEVDDLGAIMDATAQRRIVYVGHSMGGAVGVIRASQDDRIQFLVSLAGMVDTQAFAMREFGEVQPGAGFMWDDEECPLSREYMADMARIGSVVDRASRIKVPWLLIHGDEDDVVPPHESKDIFERANEPKELFPISGSNHVFQGEAGKVMVTKAVEWIGQRLGFAQK